MTFYAGVPVIWRFRDGGKMQKPCACKMCALDRRAQIREGDEVDRWKFAHRHERLAFRVAGSTQPSANLVEIGIVVAGMRDQLPDAFGQFAEEGADGIDIKGASASHGDRA